MKRGGPLKRRTPLQSRSQLKSGKPLESRSRLRPVSEKKAEQMHEDAVRVKEEGAEFVAAIAGLKCVVCGRSDKEARRKTGYGHHAHHGIPQEVLKRSGRREYLWEPMNAVCVCEEPCHRQHTDRVKRIPRAALPPSVEEFAEGLGLMAAFEREYPS